MEWRFHSFDGIVPSTAAKAEEIEAGSGFELPGAERKD
jgi:hypothetical protein